MSGIIGSLKPFPRSPASLPCSYRSLGALQGNLDPGFMGSRCSGGGALVLRPDGNDPSEGRGEGGDSDSVWARTPGGMEV